MTEYRASFDAAIRFSNGGDLTAHGFRVDVPSPDIDQDGIAALFVASLGLLMTDSVELSNVRVFAEPHKGTRAGPSDHGGAGLGAGGRLVELSHVIRAGMITYPGLPGPEITPYLTREASQAQYAPGTEFAVDRLTLVGNTGTYLDAPYHRFAGGADLSAVPLARTADLPAVVARVAGAQRRGIDVGVLAALDVRGRAVLLHTGDDARFGTAAYADGHYFLTRAGAAWLAAHDAALVGIDAVNLDDTADGARPAHTLLLAAGIPVVEHLTGLEQLPPTGAWFTAVPLRIEGLGTIPVRAFARLPGNPDVTPPPPGERHTGVVRIALWVRPGSAQPGVGGEHNGALVVRVSAPAVGGQATEAALTAVAAALGIRRHAVTLIAGASSRTKIVEVQGAYQGALNRLLANVGHGDPT